MNRWKKSLQFKIIVLFMVLVVLPIGGWGILNTHLITDEVEHLVVENTKEILGKQLESLDTLYRRCNEVAVQLMLDNTVRNALKSYTGELDIEGVQKYNHLKQSMENIMIQNSDYSNMMLISEHVLKNREKGKQPLITTGYFGSLSDLEETDWYQFTRYIFDTPALVRYDSPFEKKKENGSDLIFMIAYKNIGTNRKIGTLCIKIPYVFMNKVLDLDNSSMNVQQMAFDQKGNVIFDNTQSEETRQAIYNRHEFAAQYLCSYSERIDGEDYLILKGRSEVSKLGLVYVIPKKDLFSKINYIERLNGLVGILCLSFSFLVLGIIYFKILRPIAEIQKEMGKVEKGDFDIRVLEYGENEIGRLAMNFYNMVMSIKEKNQHIINDEKKKREYEIKILQAQINPHFLYNTLDSIKWMAVTKGEKTIERMTHALGQLLRKTISDNKEFVKIEEEVENVNCYVEIQKLRYYDSFDYSIKIEEECRNVYMPRLTLQPLIENALFHGIYNCGRRGKICVNIRREDGDVLIDITDNGRGMDVHELQKQDSVSSHNRTSKIGIANVNERIKLYYGERYGLHYESVKGEFTKVLVRIPYEDSRIQRKGEKENV